MNHNNPLMEPVFFTPPGSKRLFKGGGGGGQVYYENQDRLLGTQADIATNMYNEYANNGAPILRGLATTAAAGVDPEKYAGQAMADAQNAAHDQRDITIRNAQRMGLDPSSGNFQAMMTDSQYGATALSAGMANKARRDAENLDWARKSDISAMYSGMPGQSVQGLSAAANAYGGAANAQNGIAMANAQGYGMMGATLGKALFAKNGGMIAKRGLCLSSGGAATLQDWRTRPTSVRQAGGSNPVGQVISGMAPTAAMEMAKPVLKDAMSPVVNTIRGAGESVANGVREAFGSAPKHVFSATPTEAAIDAGALGAGNGASAVGTGAELGFDAMLADGAAGAAVDGAAAAGAAAEAGGAAAGAGALGTIGAALPWVGGALLLANAFDLFADGGEVKRKDMTGGGKVAGKGTGTSDDIPAWLSNGEYVLNAEATRMVGKSKLDAINQAGLGLRQAQGAAVPQEDARHFAMGGLAGVAMGAGVNQYMKLREQDRADNAEKRADAQLNLQQSADQRAQAKHGFEMDALQMNADEQKAVRNHMGKMQGDLQRIQSGDYSPLDGMVKQYNAQAPGMDNGYSVAMQSTPNGMQANHLNANGQVVDSVPIDKNTAAQLYMKGAGLQLAAISPKFFEKSWELGQRAEEKALDRKSHETINDKTRESQREVAMIHEKGSAARHAASMGVQAEQSRREQARFDSEAPARQMASTLGTLGLALASETDPEARKAIQQKIGDLQALAGAKNKAHAIGHVTNERGEVVMLMNDGTNVVQRDKDGNPIRADKSRQVATTAALMAKNGIPAERFGNLYRGADQIVGNRNNDARAPITQEDIAATAKKYNISEDEVRRKLGIASGVQ